MYMRCTWDVHGMHTTDGGDGGNGGDGGDEVISIDQSRAIAAVVCIE